MRNLRAVLLLISTMAVAQVKAPPPPPAAPSAAPAAPAELPPNAAVVTLEGVCATKAAQADCKTVVTRAEFDHLIEALSSGRPGGGNVPPAAKRNLAMQYAHMLLFATEAERQGLENAPETRELLRFARTQALAQALVAVLQQKARPSAAEVQKYYTDNANKYATATMRRIMIPTGGTAGGKAQDGTDLKTFADQLRQRLAAGEDPDKVQQAAYDKLGLKNPPETKLLARPESITPDQRSVFKLKAGEVSEVFAEPNGFFIYRSEGAQQIPLDSVKGEIETLLQREKFQAESEALMERANPTLNETYFGPPTGPATGPHAPGPPGAQPPPPPR